jgi:hypothetical protein
MNEQKPERFSDTLRKEREKYNFESQVWRIIYFNICSLAVISILGAGFIAIFNLGSEQDVPGLSSLLAFFSVALLGIGISHHKCQSIKRRANIIDKIYDDLSKMNPALVQLRSELRHETIKANKILSNHSMNNTTHRKGLNIHRTSNKAGPN